MNTSQKHYTLRAVVVLIASISFWSSSTFSAYAQELAPFGEKQGTISPIESDEPTITEQEMYDLADCMQITQSFNACGFTPNVHAVCPNGDYLIDGGDMYLPKCVDFDELNEHHLFWEQYIYIQNRDTIQTVN